MNTDLQSSMFTTLLKQLIKSYEIIRTTSGGCRRNPADWSFNNVPALSLIHRGFTGHQHRDEMTLINKYSPAFGRFLSADPVVQDLGNTQSYNWYSYCLNNPLKYTYPSFQLSLVDQGSQPND